MTLGAGQLADGADHATRLAGTAVAADQGAALRGRHRAGVLEQLAVEGQIVQVGRIGLGQVLRLGR